MINVNLLILVNIVGIEKLAWGFKVNQKWRNFWTYDKDVCLKQTGRKKFYNIGLFRRSMFHAPRCGRRSFGPRLFLSLHILQSLPRPMARESKSPLVMERALPQARSVAANFTGRKLYYQSHCHTRKARRSSVGDEVHCWSQCWRHEICSLYRRTKTKGNEV